MYLQSSRHVLPCRLFLPLIASLFCLIACGGNETSSPTESDTGIVEIVEDVFGGDDTTSDTPSTPDDVEVDVTPTPDDVGGDVATPTTPAPSDYILCTSDLDCPINGSSCVIYAPLNRTDSDGADEVAMSEIFDDLEAGEGVCSQPCSADPTLCEGVLWANDRGEPTSSSCVVVATGTVPYVVNSLDPFDVTADLAEIEAGQAFAALCMPALQYDPARPADFCAPCDAPSGCSDDSRCYNMLTGTLRESAADLGQSFCLETCDVDSDCPRGFSCDATDGEQSLCVPNSGTCTDCIDSDMDGFGTGHCGPASARQTAFDCNDADPTIFYDKSDPYHSFPNQCGAFDKNCDGIRDDLQQVGSPEWGSAHCTSCGDTCEGQIDGGVLRCEIQDDREPACVIGCEEGFTVCGTDPRDGCPIDLTSADYLYYEDADRDGYAAPETYFFCDANAAAAELQNPIAYNAYDKRDANDEHLFDCDDTDPDTYPGAPELCNGTINDCNQQNPITGQLGGQDVTVGDACTLPDLKGSCSVGKVVCGQDGLFCEQDVFPAAFETCNGLDDTCNGSVDAADDGDVRGADGMESVGDECPDTGLLGLCKKGKRSCVAAGTGVPVDLTCEQTIFPTLEEPGFDGVDNSCDGFDRYIGSNGRPLAVYVAANTSSTIQSALDTAASSPSCAHTIRTADGDRTVRCDVFLEAGDHATDQVVTLRAGIGVYGGLPANFPTWNIAEFSHLDSDLVSSSLRVQIPASSWRAVTGSALLVPTPLHNINIISEPYLQTEKSCRANIALACNSCPGLRLRNVEIQSGRAANAPDQTVPVGVDMNGRNGGLGEGGWAWAADGWTWWLQGGTSSVGHTGGHVSRSDSNTTLGTDGVGPRRGLTPSAASDNYQGGHGGGGVAIPQDDPTDTYGHVPRLFSNCTLNSDGSADERSHGSGGGGSKAYIVRSTNDWIYGGAGGGGGEAGKPGYGGFDGPPSIAMALYNTTVVTDGSANDSGGYFDNVTFRAGQAGAGGAATAGGNGGLMGDRGYYQSGPHPFVGGGFGGNGAGGNGGHGGKGGMSVGLFLVSSVAPANPTVSYVTGSGGAGGAGGAGGIQGNPQLSTTIIYAAEEGRLGPDGDPGLSCNILNSQDSILKGTDCR